MLNARPEESPFSTIVEKEVSNGYRFAFDKSFDMCIVDPTVSNTSEYRQMERDVTAMILSFGGSLTDLRRKKPEKPEVVIKVPEVLRVENKDKIVVSTLVCHGFSPVGVDLSFLDSDIPKEKYHFSRFDVFSQFPDWQYKGQHIESFVIPPLGSEILTTKIENATVVVSTTGCQGTIQGNNVIFGVRSKVMEPELVVFSVKFSSGETTNFCWGMSGLYEDNVREVGVYTISVHGSSYKICGENSEHPWYYFNQSWSGLKSNLEFDMNGCNYVSYVNPEAFFLVRDGVPIDAEGNAYDVKDIPSIIEGFNYSPRVIHAHYMESQWYYYSESLLRKRPDSKFRINLMLNSMVCVRDLVKYVVIPRGFKRIKHVNPINVAAIQKKTYSEKIELINLGMVPLLRDRISGTSRNAIVWRQLILDDKYERDKIDKFLMSLSTVFIGNNSYALKVPNSKFCFLVNSDPPIYLSGFPRFNVVWYLYYFRYVDFRGMFPDEFLVRGSTPYYRIFLAIKQ